jgi:hypothetical protein
MRRFYFYDPPPTLRASAAPLLAIFGELDTPESVKANVSDQTNLGSGRALALHR